MARLRLEVLAERPAAAPSEQDGRRGLDGGSVDALAIERVERDSAIPVVAEHALDAREPSGLQHVLERRALADPARRALHDLQDKDTLTERLRRLLDEGPARCRDLAALLGAKQETVRSSLGQMVRRGQIHRVSYGLYAAAGAYALGRVRT